MLSMPLGRTSWKLLEKYFLVSSFPEIFQFVLQGQNTELVLYDYLLVTARKIE